MVQDLLWRMRQVPRVVPLRQANSGAHADHAYPQGRDHALPTGQPLRVAHSHTLAIVHRAE